jgi:hypothetical protein
LRVWFCLLVSKADGDSVLFFDDEWTKAQVKCEELQDIPTLSLVSLTEKKPDLHNLFQGSMLNKAI